MGNIYHSEVIPHVPVDTSHLVSNIFVFGEGIPHDYVEVGTNVEFRDEFFNQSRRGGADPPVRGV